MHLSDLDILRCPFCGSRFTIENKPDAVHSGDDLRQAILSCQCCAYPVVDGIPYLRTGKTAKKVQSLLAAGKSEDALRTLLNLEGERADKFAALQKRGDEATYREMLDVLSPDLEGTYFLYRFSDPTFLVSEALLRALGRNEFLSRGPLLDMCGGSGHLTRTLASLNPNVPVWLADFEFWKIWLARQFIVPRCHAVCCDANHPLPFAPGTFSLVLCSGAFEYIWSRRSFAGEMWRLAGQSGAVVVTHTHNALCENPSQGMPLAPAHYRNLFEGAVPRQFKESSILDSVLSGQGVDLQREFTDEELSIEPALIIIATRHAQVFRTYDAPAIETPKHVIVNPLYQPDGPDERAFTLKFPSEYYEAEFTECRRYLPGRIELEDARNLNFTMADENMRELLRRRVLLDVPGRYVR